MDGPGLIFIVMPIVILIALFTGIALPFAADSRPGRSHARGAAGTRRCAETDQGRQAEGPAAGIRR